MKQLFVRPLGQIVVLVLLVFSQYVSADYIGRGDDGNTKPNITSSITTLSMESSLYIDDITIDVIGSDLIVNFNSSVGIATVTVADKNGNVVYQTTADTDTTSEVIIPVSFFTSGTYTVEVAYGSTVYTEQVDL